MRHDPNVTRQREPWKISFSVWTVVLGCLLTGVLFTALVWVWVWIVVPPEVLAATDPPLTVTQLTLFLGTAVTILLLVVGPLIALLVGRLLRNVDNHGLHILAFAGVGALLGGMLGGLLGLDMVLILGPTLGAAAGAARAILSRFARR